MNRQPFDIESDLVRFRKLESFDQNEVIDLLTDAEVMRFIGPQRALTLEEANEWMRENLARYQDDWNRWAIAEIRSNEGTSGISVGESA